METRNSGGFKLADLPKPLRILMVEDNPEHLDLCAEYLPKEEFVLEAALTAAEALEKLKRSTYNMIVLDYALPDLDGIELLKRIKLLGLKTPIIFSTAYDDAFLSFEALKNGAKDYVVKSFHYYKTLKERILENLQSP